MNDITTVSKVKNCIQFEPVKVFENFFFHVVHNFVNQYFLHKQYFWNATLLKFKI